MLAGCSSEVLLSFPPHPKLPTKCLQGNRILGPGGIAHLGSTPALSCPLRFKSGLPMYLGKLWYCRALSSFPLSLCLLFLWIKRASLEQQSYVKRKKLGTFWRGRAQRRGVLDCQKCQDACLHRKKWVIGKMKEKEKRCHDFFNNPVMVVFKDAAASGAWAPAVCLRSSSELYAITWVTLPLCPRCPLRIVLQMCVSDNAWHRTESY